MEIVDGWEITTVEGLGGRDTGYHPIQTKLAAAGGTQCGFCSPGMVMQLHAYLQEHPSATKQDIDNILDGNICRCTGYRPILDAFKEFASDSSKIEDIEDLKICGKTGEMCPTTCHKIRSGTCKDSISALKPSWHQPASIAELLTILASFEDTSKYRLVGGNTGTGVFKRDEPYYDALININNVPELKAETSDPVSLGGNISITDAIHFFDRIGQSDPRWLAISEHL